MVVLSVEELIARVRKTQKHTGSPQKKQRSCSLCGKPGHRSDKCPINNPPLAFRKKTDEDTIQQIRELYDSGHTIGEIKKITGCSYSVIHKYAKFKPDDYEESVDDGLE